MYIYLLATRYLRTRFIAVASIVSLTLGVATLIVVNAVMAGFVTQMHDRLHGILSDIDIQPPGIESLHYVESRLQEIRNVAGDDLEAVTTIVRVPALLQYNFAGRAMTHTLTLVGIDDETYGKVTDFQPFLLNELNREKISFDLHESGYDPALGDCGWQWRRQMAEYEQASRRQMEEIYRMRRQEESHENSIFPGNAIQPEPQVRTGLPQLPTGIPVLPEAGIQEDAVADHSNGLLRPTDSSAAYRPAIKPEDIFDKCRDQYAGIILGKAISHRQIPAADGEPARDIYLLRPGDDVSVMMPMAGSSLKPILENCTVVDLYSSHMHEYDSSFAFMSMSHLQKIRGMIDPLTGEASVSSIQIKTKSGTNLANLRDALTGIFPPEEAIVQTWQDTQRPLLNAVNLELTILNILLFLIIGVAGFGILATFFMIVVEKTRDIGILKSLGAPGRGIMTIFLGYGLSLGTVGTAVGILLGLVFVWNINAIADVIQVITGQEVYDPMIYFFDEIPTIVSPWMVMWVAIGAISIAVMASVLPAIRAARMRPVEALRYE